MDNVTHTLIGVLVGEAAAVLTKPSRDGLPQATRRALCVTTMAIGSNLPDLDFLYSTVTGSKLDYLLHHRGHTHTFVVAIFIAAAMWLAFELWAKRRNQPISRTDRMTLAALALLAPMLHIAMDLTNNYGVHPLWPFDNRWFFGDSIFIVEPLLWAAIAPTLFFLRTRIARAICALILAIGIGLAFGSGMVPMPFAIAYSIFVARLLYAGWKLHARAAVMLGLSVWVFVSLVFITTSRIAERRVDMLAHAHFPAAYILDRVLTPMPVNPICWEVIFIQQEAADLVLRRAMLSMMPTWIPAARCPGRSLDIPITAPLHRVAAIDSASLKWHGEVRSSSKLLSSLWNENCRVDAFMRFARAPWLAHLERRWVIGDLRYDREEALGFAEIEVEAHAEPCPAWVPPWVPPRRDVRAPLSVGDQVME